jgi:Spy/CpxP family protein refolding chaperone
MRKLFLAGALGWVLAVTPPVHSAEIARLQSAIPEDLADAWERLQRALQDWGGQLRERFGARDAREDRAVITQILRHKDYLALSPEQVKKLEQLRDNFQRRSIRNEADARILELDIAALLDNPAVDVAKVETKIREVEKLRADLRIARVRAIEQAKAVLTPEQRKKFYDSLDSRAPGAPGGGNPSATERERSAP